VMMIPSDTYSDVLFSEAWLRYTVTNAFGAITFTVSTTSSATFTLYVYTNCAGSAFNPFTCTQGSPCIVSFNDPAARPTIVFFRLIPSSQAPFTFNALFGFNGCSNYYSRMSVCNAVFSNTTRFSPLTPTQTVAGLEQLVTTELSARRANTPWTCTSDITRVACLKYFRPCTSDAFYVPYCVDACLLNVTCMSSSCGDTMCNELLSCRTTPAPVPASQQPSSGAVLSSTAVIGTIPSPSPNNTATPTTTPPPPLSEARKVGVVLSLAAASIALFVLL